MPTRPSTASNVLLPAPPTGFLDRAAELATAEQTLADHRYLVVWGEHGEGKSAFAGELARRLLANGKVDQVVFTSLDVHHDARGVRFEIGQQLVPKFRLAASQDPRLAGQLLERVLEEHTTLVILDHLEAVLPPDRDEPSFEPTVFEHLLGFASELSKVGQTRVLFTSLEPLPAPFEQHNLQLAGLDGETAAALVRQVVAASESRMADELKNSGLAELVSQVGHHAGSLVCLGRAIAADGIERTSARLDEIRAVVDGMQASARRKALLTGVELSLRRLPKDLRQKVRPLAVFHGGGHLTAIAAVLELDVEGDEEIRLAEELIALGLAEMLPNNYMRLHPALAPVLDEEISDDERRRASDSWAEATSQLIGFLYQEQIKNPQLASSLALLELQNLLGCLKHLRKSAQAERVAEVATAVETLVGPLGRPGALKLVEEIREEANKGLAAWSHEEFLEELTEIEVLMDCGRPAEAAAAARQALHRAEALGETAYDGADFDLATLNQTLGLAQLMTGESEHALAALEDALGRFHALAATGHEEARRMEALTFAQTGDCLRALDYLDSAADSYEQAVELSTALGDKRQVAEVKTQLGALRLAQVRNREALAAFHEARELFEELDEPRAVAEIWQQIGVVHSATRLYEAAEEAFQNALKLQLDQSDRAGAGTTLGELGELYDRMRRPEDSVDAYRRAAEVFHGLEDLAKEGIARSQMADKLIRLQRYDEARVELERTIECDAPFSHEVEPWRTFAMLNRLEEEVGRDTAAADARDKSIEAYLAYRRDGGEDKTGHGYLFAEVADAIRDGETGEVAANLDGMLRRHDVPSHLKALIPALKQLLAGSRDESLARDAALYYRDAAELLFQLETLH